MRPSSLAEVAYIVSRGESFDRCLANFLDEFYRSPNPDALAGTPELLSPRLGDTGHIQDAYLAATAEYLAAANKYEIPAWVTSEDRKLHRPWFASSLAAVRGILILESPAVFRARNLFVSENALSRA